LLAGEVDVIFGTPQSILSVLTAKEPPALITIALGDLHRNIGLWSIHNQSAKDLEGNHRHEPAAVGGSRLHDSHSERLGIPRKVTFLSTGGQAAARGGGSGHDMGSSLIAFTLQLKRKGFRDFAKLNGPTIRPAVDLCRQKRRAAEQT